MKPIMIKIFIFTIYTISYSVYATTHIFINEEHYSFESPTRLLNVLEKVKNHEYWYWSATTLYKLEHNYEIKYNYGLEKKRNNVLEKLDTLRLNNDLSPEEQAAFDLLIKQIKTWKLAIRIPIVINYELAQLYEKFNPMFDEGKYLLKVTKRPKEVHIFGARFEEGYLHHKGAADVSEYLSDINLTPEADKDYVYIIQSNNKILHVPVAYWNKKHTEVMPGSQIFIPFKQQYFSSEYEKLNYQIIFLAKNRVLP